jgi:hypothetical protein
LRCSNFACSAQDEQCHSSPAGLDHYHPLTSAECETPEPDNTGLGHCRADHPERFDRDRAIRIA